MGLPNAIIHNDETNRPEIEIGRDLACQSHALIGTAGFDMRSAVPDVAHRFAQEGGGVSRLTP